MGDNPIAAKVWMVSGCKDEQTSADVSDVQTFGLPADVGPGGAGGACTSAMAKLLTTKEWQWGELLMRAREVLLQKKYTQIPQLSSSYPLHLNEKVMLKDPNARRLKGLLMGINYVGHKQGVLSGCHNDVDTWKNIIGKEGFNDVEVLKDDGASTPPTKANIEAAMLRLVSGAQAGDSLFMQYSGHGSQVKDTSGDEESGMDQVLVPMDYNQPGGGIIVDDWIFDKVVKDLPAGVTLFCVMDCCHSGSIMDLPYAIPITNAVVQQYNNNPSMELPTNKAFHIKHKRRLAAVAAAGVAGCCVGGPVGCIVGMCGAFCCMWRNEIKDKGREIKAQVGQI